MQENIQTTQTKDKQYPKLFNSFFDKELDYKNDFVNYIEVTPTQDYNIQNCLSNFKNREANISKKIEVLEDKRFLANGFTTPQNLAQILGHANAQMVYQVYAKYINDGNFDFNFDINLY